MVNDRKEERRAEASGAAACPEKRPAEGSGVPERLGDAPAGIGTGAWSVGEAQPNGEACGVPRQAGADMPERLAGCYDLMSDGAGRVLLVVDACDGEPEHPRLVYDGSDRMAFHRSRRAAFTIDGLTAEAREALAGASEVTVAEIGGEEVVREYDVALCRVRSLRTLAGAPDDPEGADR